MSSPAPIVSRRHFVWMSAFAGLAATGCSQIPTSGPSSSEVEQASGAGPIQLVDVDDGVARQLLAQRAARSFAELSGATAPGASTIGKGDVVEVTIWESPPATLFGSSQAVDPRQPSAARAMSLPEQMVDRDGLISVPFAGRIRAAGQSPQAVETEIIQRLRGKANQPEVLVRVVRNASALVTVVGEVNASVRVPLTASGERLLDALAAAGGVRQPVSKMSVQLTRGARVETLPLDLVIRDPSQNIALQPGDVITALFQPLSFTALGATGKNEEIAFETQGITLAQALARAGGLQDLRSNPEGVFIFRFEKESALKWPRTPVSLTPDGLVPVVYRINLRNPGSFFVMQSFPMQQRDVMYVSNAPAAELQKFLNLVFTVFYPVTSLISATK